MNTLLFPANRVATIGILVLLVKAWVMPSSAFCEGFAAGAGSAIIRVLDGEVIGAWGSTKQTDGALPFDDAKATALMLISGGQKITVVAVDTLLIYDFQLADVKKQLEGAGINTEIYLVATHSHATLAPDGTSEAKGQVGTPNERIVAAIFQAVRRASEAVVPARFGFGSGEYVASFNRVLRGESRDTTQLGICKQDLVNSWRIAHPDPVDDEVGVLLILDRETGSTIASVFNYAAHPVIFGGCENRWATPGYPGQARRLIEARLGGKAVFLQGAAGDINPPCSLLQDTEAHLAMMQFANGLASVVVSVGRTLKAKLTNRSQSTKVVAKTGSVKYRSQCECARCPALDSESSLSVGLITIGESIAIATIAGEPFAQIGLDIKRELKRAGYELVMVAGYTNEAVGYIPDERSYGRGAYGTVQSSANHKVMCMEQTTARAIIERVGALSTLVASP